MLRGSRKRHRSRRTAAKARHRADNRQRDKEGNGQSAGKKKADVHIGFDGIHVEDGKDKRAYKP